MGREATKSYKKTKEDLVITKKTDLKKIQEKYLSNTDVLLSAKTVKLNHRIYLDLNYDSEVLGKNKTAKVEYARDSLGLA